MVVTEVQSNGNAIVHHCNQQQLVMVVERHNDWRRARRSASRTSYVSIGEREVQANGNDCSGVDTNTTTSSSKTTSTS
jgi:hypothetical protein